MSSTAPVRFDPWHCCDEGKKFSGAVSIDRMPRLTPFLASREGEAAFALRCFRDEERRAVIAVEIEATLVPRCQRCLECISLPVRSLSQVAVVQGLDEAARLPDGLEPHLCEDGEIELSRIVEDELLLALPDVPMHAEGECDAPDTDSAPRQKYEASPKRENPFAELAALKKDQTRN